jgi:hypothetical protein
MKKYNAVPQAYLLEQFKSWRDILDHNGVGHIFFLPHTGLLYRAHQFVDWLVEQKYSLPIIDMDLEMYSDPSSFVRLLERNPTPSLIVARQNFASVDRKILSQTLQNYYTKNICSLLIFHEASPLQLQLADNAALPSVMFQNNQIYALPDCKFSLAYINNFAASNNVSLRDTQMKEIYDWCGNQPWLTNELVRLIGLNPDLQVKDLLMNESLIQRSEYLWNHLYVAYQKCLLGHAQTEKERMAALSELVDFGYLEEKSFKPTGKWLSEAIQRSKINMMQISHDSLTVNGVEIKYLFSPGELRILNILWKNKTASREEIARGFWLEEFDNSYTDWALDQVVSRLRKKILLNKLPIEIKTKRGVGYAA